MKSRSTIWRRKTEELDGKEPVPMNPRTEAGIEQLRDSGTTPAANTVAPSDRLPAEAPAAPARRSAPLALIAVLAIVVVLGGVQGYRWWQFRQSFVATDNAMIRGNVVAVSTNVAGRVQALLADEGTSVRAGQVIARLDDADFRMQLANAEAALVVARTRLRRDRTEVGYQGSQSQERITRAQADLASASSTLDSARAKLADAGAQAAKARADFNRMARLHREGVVSDQQLQATRATLSTTEAQVITAQAAVKGTTQGLRSAAAAVDLAKAGQAQVTISQSELETTRAQIKQAEVSVAQARLALSRTTIYAPVAGRIARRTANLGEYVQPGQPLFNMAQDGKVWIVANVDETSVGRVRAGASVDIQIDAYEHHSFRGHVAEVGSATGEQFSLFPKNNASGNFIKVVQRIPVRIDIQNDGYELKPGMSVQVAINAR